MLFAFLDDCLSKSSSVERARLDEILYDKLSDYAANHQMLVAVRLHRPQSASRNVKEVLKSEDRKAWRMDKLIDITYNDKVALGKLLKYLYGKPSPSGQRDHNWLQHSEIVRKAVETFWARTREYWRKAFEKAKFSSEDIQADLEI